MNTDIDKFACYNSLNRKALIGGVPIVTLVIFLCAMIVTGFGGVFLFDSFKALIMPVLLAFILMLVKIKCTDDSRAMESFWWDVKGAVAKIRCGSTVASFTSTSDSQRQRKGQVHEWFKNNTTN
jgi:type IV secretion system protein VirB3